MSGKVAYQGVSGAFGEVACRTFLPEWRPLARPNFASVVDTVQTGEAGRGVLPLCNYSAGEVPGVDDLIRTSGPILLARRRLPVPMHLFGLPNASLGKVQRVASHPMAVAQRRKWLRDGGFTAEEEANTAVAAQGLAASGDLGKAAIAPDAKDNAFGILARHNEVQ